MFVTERHQSSVEIDLAMQKERLSVLDWNVFFLVVLSNESKGVVVAFESAVGKHVVVSIHCQHQQKSWYAQESQNGFSSAGGGDDWVIML